MKDSKAREIAVIVKNSAIVQAPAGSGKTYLLAQRFIALLCEESIKSPEKILALTFGKKATREIRHRIISWLKQAVEIKSHPEKNIPINFPEIVFKLAEKNQQQNWQLLENPHLLQISTFDSLCKKITKLDIFNYTDQLQIIDNPSKDTIYKKAIERLMLDAAKPSNENADLTNAVNAGINAFKGDLDGLNQHLINVVANYDNWSDLLTKSLFTDKKTQHKFHKQQNQNLTELLTILSDYALSNLQKIDGLMSLMDLSVINETEKCIHKWVGSADVNASPENKLSACRCLAYTLLTSKQDWAKNPNASKGFPTAKDYKTLNTNIEDQQNYTNTKGKFKSDIMPQIANLPNSIELAFVLSQTLLSPDEYTKKKNKKA